MTEQIYGLEKYYVQIVFFIYGKTMVNLPKYNDAIQLNRKDSKPMSENKGGQPRRFQDGQELEQTMMDYISWCDGNAHMPNIAGFCVHCDITQDTFYQQKNYYPESYQKVQSLLETAVINNGRASDTMKIFYMKNKFRYTDKVQQEIITPEPLKIQHYEKLSDDELLLLKNITKKIESDD